MCTFGLHERGQGVENKVSLFSVEYDCMEVSNQGEISLLK